MPGIRYVLTRKNVKNINLRIRSDGSVAVSAPRRVSTEEIEAFVSRRQAWIEKTRDRVLGAGQSVRMLQISGVSDAMCRAHFLPVMEACLQLLGQREPVLLRIRTCTSRWGSCQKQKRVIMLNRLLYFVPLRLMEYVVLHECAHLLYDDHQKNFHRVMARHMPDYRARRKQLRQWTAGGNA